MPGILRMDHVGITVVSLEAAVVFFTGLGPEGIIVSLAERLG
ncbi:hypothetical protein GCM10009596_22090 [Arthrobacter rhombi]